MGGNQVPAHPTEDGWDEEGYDESQRAEIIEATQDGPSNGTILTDIPQGFDDPDKIASDDELTLIDDEFGAEDDDAELDEDDRREDEIQADLDDEDVEEEDLDAETEDGEESFLAP